MPHPPRAGGGQSRYPPNAPGPAQSVGNAVKFSPPHGLIELGVEHRPQGVVVTVSDQDVGIPAGEEGAIFDKFIQSE